MVVHLIAATKRPCEKLKGLFVAPVVEPVSNRVPSVGHFVTPGKRRVRGAAGSFISSAIYNKHKKKPGKTKKFVAGGVLSTELTDKIIHGLKDRKHLEDNEINLLNCLLSTYSRDDIKIKKKMTKGEKRLLGQLALVEFRDVPDGKSVSLLNFHGANEISLVKLP